MRTTITLDPDADAAVRQLMRARNLTFKQAVNEAIRRGTSSGTRTASFRTRSYRMGRPEMPLDHALRLASQLEDDEIIRKLAQRK